jgi:hypothetical protein
MPREPLDAVENPPKEAPCQVALGQPLRVVGVLVPGQAAIDGLAKKIRQGELVVVSGAGIGEVSLNTRTSSGLLLALFEVQS